MPFAFSYLPRPFPSLPLTSHPSIHCLAFPDARQLEVSLGAIESPPSLPHKTLDTELDAELDA